MRLFQHPGEAVVFWVCAAALALVALLSFFRYAYLTNAARSYADVVGELRPIIADLERLNGDGDREALEEQIRQLRLELDRLRSEAGADSPRVVPEPRGDAGDAAYEVIRLD